MALGTEPGGAAREQPLGGTTPVHREGSEEEETGWGTESTQEEEGTRTNIKGGGRRRENKAAPDGHPRKKFSKEEAGKDRAAEEVESQVGQVRAWSEGQSVFLQEKISAIHVDPEALIQGRKCTRRVEAFSSALLPTNPKTPQPGKPGESWSKGCPDGGGVSSELSQVKGRNRPRTSPEVPVPSSRGLRGQGQPEAACSGRAGPQAERKQTQASWCGPQAVLPITCFPGLQGKTCGKKGDREKGQKERKVRARGKKILHSISKTFMECRL